MTLLIPAGDGPAKRIIQRGRILPLRTYRSPIRGPQSIGSSCTAGLQRERGRPDPLLRDRAERETISGGRRRARRIGLAANFLFSLPIDPNARGRFPSPAEPRTEPGF